MSSFFSKFFFFLFSFFGLSLEFVQSQTPDFIESIGGSLDEYAQCVQVDNIGNVYLTGRFSGTCDFDPGSSTFNLISKGAADIFFAKYNKLGELVFAKSIGSSGDDSGESLAIDSKHELYIGGYFSDTVDFDPGTSVKKLSSKGATDIFFARFDSTGNLIFAKAMGETDYDGVNKLIMDSKNNIYILGFFSNTFDTDPGNDVHNLIAAGQSDIFFCKYDLNGNFIYAKDIGGKEYETGSDFKVDIYGNLVITGYFRGTADFDPDTSEFILSSKGNYDIFLARYDKNGVLLFAKSMGNKGDDESRSLGVDKDGYLFISGYFEKTVDFDPGDGITEKISKGNADMFFAKYDSTGQFIAAQSHGGIYDDAAYVIHIDGIGNIHVAGTFGDSVDFEESSAMNVLKSRGANDIFLCTYNQSGKLIQLLQMGGKGDDGIESICSDNMQRISFSAHFNDSVQYSHNTDLFKHSCNGGYDILFGKFNPVGTGVEKINVPDQILELYPNPSNGIIHIQTKNKKGTLSIRNLLGQEVLSRQVAEGSNKNSIDLSGHQPGLYFINFITNAGIYTRSIFIQ